MKGADEHRERAGHQPITLAIVTVSDTRTPETDVNRQYLEARLEELGHIVAAYHLIKDEPDQVAAALDELTGMPHVRIVLFNGGTGIAPRDTGQLVLLGEFEGVSYGLILLLAQPVQLRFERGGLF